MTTRSEIESLVFLLDDPDPYVKQRVKTRLLELGEKAVPLLDEQKTHTKNEEERELINEIIQWITYGSLEEDFIDVLENGLGNLKQLEEAVFILARLENPTLREGEYKKKLDRFANMIEDDLRYQLDDSKKMHQLLNFVFDELSFSGDSEDYYHPDNSYFHRVIDRRKGLPISLGLVVLFLARRLDLPFHGVNMPIHFMLKYQGEKDEMLVDPFDNGKVVSYNQCYFFLKQNGIEPKSEHFETAAEGEILARCIRNLIQSFSRRGKEEKVKNLKNLLNILEMFIPKGAG